VAPILFRLVQSPSRSNGNHSIAPPPSRITPRALPLPISTPRKRFRSKGGFPFFRACVPVCHRRSGCWAGRDLPQLPPPPPTPTVFFAAPRTYPTPTTGHKSLLHHPPRVLAGRRAQGGYQNIKTDGFFACGVGRMDSQPQVYRLILVVLGTHPPPAVCFLSPFWKKGGTRIKILPHPGPQINWQVPPHGPVVP